MLTGRRAFAGSTVSDTIAAIISGDPDWAALPRSTPSGVRRLLARCLEKDQKRRSRDIGDVRLELEETLATDLEKDRIPESRPTRRWRGLWVLTFTVLAAAAGIAGLVWVIQSSRNDPSPPITRAALTLPSNQRLDTANMALPLALSPDDGGW
jgi:hypothetical protein